MVKGWFIGNPEEDPANQNKDIDVPSPQGNDGNSSWWDKPDKSNDNPKKK